MVDIDKEAQAYSECVDALKKLNDPDRTSYGSTYTEKQRVRRVLASLASRWGFEPMHVIHHCDGIQHGEWATERGLNV